MTVFDVSRIRDHAVQNFSAAWVSTADLLPRGTKIEIGGMGKPHPVREMVETSRQILLGLGFNEAENPTILPESDVSKQYGPEARVILDRAYYLAELPRPEIGISARKVAQVKSISDDIDMEELQKILREYKRGDIEADDLVQHLVDRLQIADGQATELLDRVFPEVRNLKPVASDLTLRSHMTATWFHTLAAVQSKAAFPVALFSVGPRYRNEQREDARHLRVHHSASVVVMDGEMSLEAGREITDRILQRYGFEDVKFVTKSATSKYYAPGQEQEVFSRCRGEWVEVADIGMYSPIALANFGIKYPVFNAGMGIERLTMILQDADDVRKVAYPQFAVAEFKDEDIARSVMYIRSPRTSKGKRIARAIEQTARRHGDEVAPCEFVAWQDRSLEVKIVEEEPGQKLIGPAGFNEVCVSDGSIYGDVRPSGVHTGVNYMRALAMGVAGMVEDLDEGEAITYQVKVARHLSDVNLDIPDVVRRHIERQQKRIAVKGAVFLTVKARRLGKS
ncbi:MAG: O-phosphoserine--tRNA ligase [Chloroflexota bacterium]